MKWTDLVKTLAPVILATVPGVPPVLVSVIPEIIVSVEKLIGAKKGSEKLDKAADLAATAYKAVAVVHDGPEPAPEVMDKAVRTGISAVVQAVNVVQSFQAKPAA